MSGKKKITSKGYTNPLRRPGEKREDLNTQEREKKTPSPSTETDRGASLGVVQVLSNEKDAKDNTCLVSQETNEKPVEDVSPIPVPIDAGKDQYHANTKLLGSQESEEIPACKAEKVEKPLDEKEEETKLPQESDVHSNATKETAKTNKNIKEGDQKEHTAMNHNETSLTEATSKISNLSPFAREFVPKASFNLASVAKAPEFEPASVPPQFRRAPLLQKMHDTPGNELMNCVKDVLFRLTQRPGESGHYFDTLVLQIRKHLGSLNSFSEVVELIFEYSITQPNFHYIAAKLCNMLSKEDTIILESGENFRSVFMNRCRDEHKNREEALKNPQTLTQLLGFAIFEAELFCNYRPSGELLKELYRGLLEMLSTLLQNHTEECLVCICKILKMTGYLLDDSRIMETDSEKKQKVDKVFSDVEQLLKESTLSERSKRFLSQVRKLRASSWSSCPAVGASGTSFYFPSDDECSFSHYGLGLDDLSIDDDLIPVTNPEQWNDYLHDGEDDNELQDAYKY
ncbi:unnamed protein product [Pocillopora meandrina]|uniref:MIF4G domain-containing protein n=1 Tax=Pocillopora meandrina TaxID=46732 RepID=A0AAU9WKA0_9CNID|nr:unnamed protein product [Pocillopora meandrina]